MPADGADSGPGRGPSEDRRREDEPDGCAGGCAPPGTLAGGRLVLVLMNVAAGVLGDHGRIVGTHHALSVRVLDDLIVTLRCCFIRVCRYQSERRPAVLPPG